MIFMRTRHLKEILTFTGAYAPALYSHEFWLIVISLYYT